MPGGETENKGRKLRDEQGLFFSTYFTINTSEVAEKSWMPASLSCSGRKSMPSCSGLLVIYESTGQNTSPSFCSLTS